MLYIFDMDGVLWCMDDPIAGGPEAIARLKARGDAVYYLTNNSSKTRQDYVEKLARFGIEAEVDEVVTSAYATAQILASEGAAGKRAYVVGEAGLRSELEAVGIQVAAVSDTDPVDYVVVGWDRGLSYEKLTNAHLAVMGGAAFVATNRDATYPDAGGRTLPGGGSIVAALATSTALTPRTIGKPEPFTLDLILQLAGRAREECIVVGDRLDTDIELGLRHGARTALVLTGVSTRAEVDTLPADRRPTYVLENLADLP